MALRFRRRMLSNPALFIPLALFLVYLFWTFKQAQQPPNLLQRRSHHSSHRRVLNKQFCVILVTDESNYGPDGDTPYISRVIENREEYAKAQGYALYYVNSSSFELNGANTVWAKMPAMLEAMKQYPDIDYFWFLDKDAIIMDPSVDLYDHVFKPQVLRKLIMRDWPIVPPESAIHTLKNPNVKNVDLLLTQDYQGLSHSSIVFKRGSYAEFFLQFWFDPMYRFYPFNRMDQQALEHMVQWHYYILNRLALIPSRLINSLSHGSEEYAYREGDFVVSFAGCRSAERSCTKEFDRYWLLRGRAVFE